MRRSRDFQTFSKDLQRLGRLFDDVGTDRWGCANALWTGVIPESNPNGCSIFHYVVSQARNLGLELFDRICGLSMYGPQRGLEELTFCSTSPTMQPVFQLHYGGVGMRDQTVEDLRG